VENRPLAQKAHTQVPNLVSDAILPLLTSPERDCLHYIIRCTYGFADGHGQRKERDTISLDQFETGKTSGDYLLDLGTQLSRNTIRRALQGLEEKELVIGRYACTHCLWEQDAQAPAPPLARGGQGRSCPRCRASLSRSYAMAELTPRKIVTLLNTYDKQQRQWSWDHQRSRFRFQDRAQQAREQQTHEDLTEEAQRLRKLLWYPKMIDEAIALAERQLTSGRTISLTRRINNFYRPVWELQEEYHNPPLIKYALEQTLKGPALKNPKTHSWLKYLTVVVKNNEQRFAGGGPAPGTNAETESRESLVARERAVREMLGQAAIRNEKGDREAARALLSDILSQVKDLAALFDGDRQRCERSLREAFKQGTSYFVGIEPNPFGLDFYSEWSWPTDE
jgi:hypothetical protein